MDLSLLTQAYRTVEEAGPDGVSQMELARTMGQTKLHSRTLCRNLLRRGLVVTFMKDVGRQRVSRCVILYTHVASVLPGECPNPRRRNFFNLGFFDSPWHLIIFGALKICRLSF